MILSYFDSSMILAILFDESKKQEAYDYWVNGNIKISSILLKVESIVSLRRTFEQNKRALSKKWLSEKINILDEYLNEVNYRIIDTKIERRIYSNNDLSQCRSLDAIHIATALNFREINNNKDVIIYTYDKMMHNLAVHYDFQTNAI